MASLMGFDMTKAHIKGKHASQNLLQHIDVEKCALWALPSGGELYIKPPPLPIIKKSS